MKYYITLVIVTILSIFSMVLLPYYADKSQEKKVEKSIDFFKSNSDVGDELFDNVISKGHPKILEGFNFDKLKELGKKIDVDFSDTIKKMKAPYGSFWIESALGMITVGGVNKMAKVIFSTNISTLKLTNLAILITLILFVLLFMMTKKQINETGKKSTFISIFIGLVAILGLFAFFITKSADFISLIKNPLTSLNVSFDTAPIFTYSFIVMVLETIFVLIISLKLILGSSKNSKEAFFWIIPMIFIIVMGLFSLNSRLAGLRLIIQRQNINYKKQKIIQNETDAIYTIRQWVKSNEYKDFTKFSAKELNIPKKSKYTDYEITTDGSKVTIINTIPYQSDFNQKDQFKVTYDAQSDSIKTKTLSVVS